MSMKGAVVSDKAKMEFKIGECQIKIDLPVKAVLEILLGVLSKNREIEG